VTADAFEGLRGLDAGGGVGVLGRRLAPVRWRVENPERSLPLQLAGFGAAGPGTPTAAGGVAYVPAARGGLVALDASSGAVRWRASDEGRAVTRPALRDRRAYVGQYGGSVRALDVADGSERWRASVPERRVLAPTALADVVVVPDRTGVTALDPGSGEELWRHRLDGADVDAPVAATGETVVVATELGADGRDGVLALNAATGERRWARFDVDARRAPTVAGDVVLVPAARGVRALSLSDGADLWRHPTGIPPSTVSVAGGTVYVAAESLLALEAAA
jgi:outer membrane protein assembly factor BamB